MTSSRLPTLVTLALLLLPASRVRVMAARCDPGRFVASDARLLAGSAEDNGSEAIVISPRPRPRISIDPGCDAVRGRIKVSRRATRLSATWPRGSCRGVAGRVRLTGRITDGCSLLTGVLKRRSEPPRAFTARRATGCGDGVLDGRAGERCERDADCGSTTCAVLGLLHLELLSRDLMTF
jgi:hypothetical protein